MDPAARMQTLLHYANSAKVARGLTENGYPVSGPTVSRWAQGKNVTPRAVRLVADLLGQQEVEPPEWARQLNEKMDRLLARDALHEVRRRGSGLAPDEDPLPATSSAPRCR